MAGLSKAKEKEINKYYKEMLMNGIRTKTINKKEATKGVKILYKKYLDMDCPEVVFVESPTAAVKELIKRGCTETEECIYKEIKYLNLWTFWVAYFHAGINILKETKGVDKELISKCNEYEELVHHIHAILPTDVCCVVINYPEEIHIKDKDYEKFIVSNKEGYAVKYRDNTGVCVIDGIQVPDYIALTPAKKLDPIKVLAEVNVDIRRVGLDKVGMERTLKAMKPTVLDVFKGKKKWQDYELLETNFGDKRRVILKMKNPSTKKYHFERVEDDITTVKQALAWRDNEEVYEEPIILT